MTPSRVPPPPGEAASEGFEIATLRSGARAVRDRTSGEVMHPVGGPWAEANALYVVQTQLARLLQDGSETRPLVLFDVGLGAAANAVAALACARSLGATRKRPLELVSFERDLRPLELALGDAEGFGYLRDWNEAARTLASRGEWHGDGLCWRLFVGDFLERLDAGAQGASGPAEVVFFDPFSPKANPELWTRSTFERLRRWCRGSGEASATADGGALLATYSTATPTRVSMLLGGFFVGTAVPEGGVREATLAATVGSRLAAPLGGRWLERWKRSSARGPHGEPLTQALEQLVLAHPQWREG